MSGEVVHSEVLIQDSRVYGRVFWLSYVANVTLVTANALTFRFAELVAYLGGSEKAAGDIVSLGLLVAVLVRLCVSHLIDHYGTRRLWTIASLLMMAGAILFLLIHDISWTIYAARMAFVVGLTGMFACSITHIQHHVPAQRRTEVIGNLGSSGFIGMIAGTQLGDTIFRLVPGGREQFLWLFGTSAFLVGVYLTIVLVLTAGTASRRQSTPPAFKLLVRYWPGPVVLVALMMGLGIAVSTVFLTRFATSLSLTGVGTFFTAYALSAFTFRLAAQTWSRTIGRHWMLIRGLAGYAIGMTLLPLVRSEWHFIFPAIAYGFGHALLFPAVVSLGAGAFPKEYRGTGTAMILALVDFGSLAFAPILGRIIVQFGFTAMFLTGASLCVTAATAYWLLFVNQPDLDFEDRLAPVAKSADASTDRERQAETIAAEPVARPHQRTPQTAEVCGRG